MVHWRLLLLDIIFCYHKGDAQDAIRDICNTTVRITESDTALLADDRKLPLCFLCSTSSGTTNPNTRWILNSQYVSDSNSNPNVNIVDGVLTYYRGLSNNEEVSCFSTSSPVISHSRITLWSSRLFPPKVSPALLEPIEGSSVTFLCDAPPNAQVLDVTVRWLGPNGILISDQYFGIINDIHRNQSGHYTCELASARGELSFDTISINVHYIPTVRPHSRTTLYVYPGEEFTLACSITDSVGDFRVVWYNEGTPVQDDVTSKDHIYQIVGRNRGGKYSCTASNIAGNASVDFTVHVFPEPVTRLYANASTHHVLLDWVYQYNGSSPRIGVAIDIWNKLGIVDRLTEGPERTSVNISLLPFTTYTIMVYAVNAIGRSMPVSIRVSTHHFSMSGTERIFIIVDVVGLLATGIAVALGALVCLLRLEPGGLVKFVRQILCMVYTLPELHFVEKERNYGLSSTDDFGSAPTETSSEDTNLGLDSFLATEQ